MLIESTAQTHSGAGELSLRKPNPFKADPSPFAIAPALIGNYIKKTHFSTHNSRGYFMAAEVAKIWSIIQPTVSLGRRPNIITQPAIRYSTPAYLE